MIWKIVSKGLSQVLRPNMALSICNGVHHSLVSGRMFLTSAIGPLSTATALVMQFVNPTTSIVSWKPNPLARITDVYLHSELVQNFREAKC